MATANKYGGVGRGQYGPGLKVVYTGPFFDNDPTKTFRQNERDFIEAVMEYGYQTALQAAPYHNGYFRAALRRGDALRFGRADTNRKWALTGVLSMRKLAAPWHSGAVGGAGHSKHWYTAGRTSLGIRSGGAFNYAGRVEAKYHVFRKAKAAVYSARRHNAELLKGLT